MYVSFNIKQLIMTTKLANIKNPVFKENTTDPTNGRTVKSIWLYSKYNHGKSEKWDLRWQYYRDRNRTSVLRFFKDHKGRKVKIIYSGDPIQYIVDIPLHSDMIDCTKINNDVEINNNIETIVTEEYEQTNINILL